MPECSAWGWWCDRVISTISLVHHHSIFSKVIGKRVISGMVIGISGHQWLNSGCTRVIGIINISGFGGHRHRHSIANHHWDGHQLLSCIPRVDNLKLLGQWFILLLLYIQVWKLCLHPSPSLRNQLFGRNRHHTSSSDNHGGRNNTTSFHTPGPLSKTGQENSRPRICR